MLHFDRNSRRMTFAREPFKFQKSKFGFFFLHLGKKGPQSFGNPVRFLKRRLQIQHERNRFLHNAFTAEKR